MIGERLKLLRLARGLTMDALSAAVGGIVTKQAISKYELGKDVPSPRVLTKLAAALDVKSVDLWREPAVLVELVAYRKGSGLGKIEQRRVESMVAESLERRVRLQELTSQTVDADVPVKGLRVDSLAAAEEAAAGLKPRVRTIREKVFTLLTDYRSGLTSEEIAGHLRTPYHTVQPRTSELRLTGQIEDSGRRRPKVTRQPLANGRRPKLTRKPLQTL